MPKNALKFGLLNFLWMMIPLISFQSLRAQTVWIGTDTLSIDGGFSQLQLNDQIRFFSTDVDLSADSVWKKFQQKEESIKTLNKIHFGPVNGFYWLALTVKNNSRLRQELYFQVRTPHVYQLTFFQVIADSLSTNKWTILKGPETGIRYNFYQRPSPHRFFDFPFACNPGKTYTLLFKVYHLNSLTLPLYLISKSELQQNNYTSNLIWGYWFGFLSFCALFAFIALIVFRKTIFIWYFLYISSAALFGFTEQGYGFQFFYPSYENLDALVIVQMAVYVFIFLIKFSQGLLETKKHQPIIHRVLNGIFYFLLVLLIAGVTLQEFMFRMSTYILPVVNLVVLTGLILLAVIGIRSLFTNRIIAIFYLAAYMMLVCASIFSNLNYGFGVFQYNGPNPILITYFFEAIVLSIALVILFRQTQRERSRLAEQVSSQQKQMYQQYIDGIEKERNRVAGELHDDIGNKLSHIKQILTLKREGEEEVVKKIGNLMQDIRRLSHDLAPPVAHISGLRPLIEGLVSETRSVSPIDFRLHFYDFEEKFNTHDIQQIYRIVQEAIHNITHHSRATRADIQFFGYEDELTLVIEDDGIGFDPKLFNDGIGLNQMKIRTESLGGKMEVNSHPGTGTNLVFNIPLKKD